MLKNYGAQKPLLARIGGHLTLGMRQNMSPSPGHGRTCLQQSKYPHDVFLVKADASSTVYQSYR
jgi:hypothetical protein